MTKQALYIVKKTPLGLFLHEEPGELLGGYTLQRQEAQTLENYESLQVGDQVEVYLYYDQKDKIVATLKAPKVALGTMGILEVVSSNHYGAFVNVGYDKDILVPFSEQLTPLKKGHKPLICLYIDKSGRVCGSQKVKKVLMTGAPYKEGDEVEGIIYDVNDELGAFVAIDGKYYGLIFATEVLPSMKAGASFNGRVTKVRDDGKLNLTPTKRVDLQMDEDSQRLLELLKDNDGFLPYHDKTDSEVIRRIFGMSKKAFKRAIGKLYKDQLIDLKEDGIHLI